MVESKLCYISYSLTRLTVKLVQEVTLAVSVSVGYTLLIRVEYLVVDTRSTNLVCTVVAVERTVSAVGCCYNCLVSSVVVVGLVCVESVFI